MNSVTNERDEMLREMNVKSVFCARLQACEYSQRERRLSIPSTPSVDIPTQSNLERP